MSGSLALWSATIPMCSYPSMCSHCSPCTRTGAYVPTLYYMSMELQSRSSNFLTLFSTPDLEAKDFLCKFAMYQKPRKA